MFTLNIKQNNLLSTLPKGNVRSTSKSPISSWGTSPALDDHILYLSQETWSTSYQLTHITCSLCDCLASFSSHNVQHPSAFHSYL